MARRREEEADWYVDMSDLLERRERRRKWVVLGVCVVVPLALMGFFLLYVALDERGVIAKIRDRLGGFGKPAAKVIEEPVLGPVSVESLEKENIKFPQLDGAGMVTSVTFYFQELTPEGSDVFTVNRKGENDGVVLRFRLRDVATGEAFEFRDVPVKRYNDTWAVTDDGWLQIKNDLQARKNVPLGKPLRE